MKKKLFITIGLLITVCSVIFIPAVNSLAQSALSIFRVNSSKTINITIADIEQAVNYFESTKGKLEGDKKYADDDKDFDHDDKFDKNEKKIQDVSEFTYFDFKLPAMYDGVKPELSMNEPETESITLDTGKINKEFSELNMGNLLDEKYNGTEIKVTSPPFISAEYDNADVNIFATQSPVVDAPKNVLEDMKKVFLSMPFISENLRSQLNSISVDTKDVYLPVVVGFGREVNINNTVGYIYNSKDFKNVVSSIPQIVNHEEMDDMDDNDNESILLWVNDGVLYGVSGEKTDSELTDIARSIK